MAFTPFASHCFGVAFAKRLIRQQREENQRVLTICIGRDPRPHGERLADAFARGAESVDGVRVVYTGLASTPAMYEFCRCVQLCLKFNSLVCLACTQGFVVSFEGLCFDSLISKN